VKKKFAVFDIDGTLIRWQLYHAAVDALASKGHLGLDASEQIHAERMTWKKRAHSEAFSDYEKFMIGLYEKALINLQPKIFDQIVSEVAEKYKDQVYTYTRDLILQLKKDGYFLLAISGSHNELVEIVAKQHGFDDWIGSTYNRNGDKFTGEIKVVSQNKKTELEKLITRHDLTTKGSYAIGDSHSDAVMMDMVSNPIAFNPDRRLFDYSRAKGWRIVVERKNMIYELEEHNGKYLLAKTNI